MSKLDGILSRKRSNAEYLRNQLADEAALELPVAKGDRTHTYMLFTLKVRDGMRDRVAQSLQDRGIEARLYFPPAHLQPVFVDATYSLPRTERLAQDMLSVPFHSRLTQAELDAIADALKQAVASTG